MQNNELYTLLHCFCQGGTIVVKTVLDNPDICQGAILSAPALQVDPNVIGGPFKVSSTSSAMNASFDLSLKILLTVTCPCPYINFCIHVPFLRQLLATKLDESGTNHSKLRPRNSFFWWSQTFATKFKTR